MACHATRTWLVTAVSGTQAGCEVQVWDYSSLSTGFGRARAATSDGAGGYGDDGGGELSAQIQHLNGNRRKPQA